MDSRMIEMLLQSSGAATDMAKNYFDMRFDNTVGNDDYFHCKANYEATQRGKYGEAVAQALGDEKEFFDYYKNIYLKGMTPEKAYADYLRDKAINELSRHLVKDDVYYNSREACDLFRVKDINDKY